MSGIDESMQQLMEITGLDEWRSITLLEMHNFNLQQALNYHLENSDFKDVASSKVSDNTPLKQETSVLMDKLKLDGNSDKKPNNEEIDLENSNDTSFVSENASLPDIIENANGMLSSNTISAGTNLNLDEDNIRPPIPSKREQLLLPEEDQFRLHYSGVHNPRKRRSTASGLLTFCPFRDFAREAQIQEEISDEYNNLASYDGAIGGSEFSTLGSNPFDYISGTSNNNNNNSNDNNQISNNKRTNLRHKKKSMFYDNNSHNDDFETKELDKSLLRGNKRKRLEDLFRPPVDLLFWGTFQAARDHATGLNRWLIVNLQDQREFKSQVLNRDVWSDKEVKEIVSSNFILWQVSMENPEGLRFKTFYHVSECPYICVIDPRTGEERLVCDKARPKNLYDDLMKFLTENDFCLDLSLKITKPITSRTAASSTATSNSISTVIPSVLTNSKNNVNNTKIDCDNDNLKLKTPKTLDLSEEDQLELAIKNSLKETQCSMLDASNESNENDKFDTLHQNKSNNYASLIKSNNESNDFIESDYINEPINKNNTKFSTSSEQLNKNNIINNINTINGNLKSISYTDFIGKDTDSITKIQIRSPSGEREDIELPSSSVVKCLKLYVCEKYPDITKDTYKLIQSYPRKNILDLQDNMTLIEAELHPTSILYLHPDE